MKTIYLAGGCFWGLEAYLKRLSGVQATNRHNFSLVKANQRYFSFSARIFVIKAVTSYGVANG